MSESYAREERFAYLGPMHFRQVIATGGATATAAALAHTTRAIVVQNSTATGATIATVKVSFAGHAAASAVSIRVPLCEPLSWAVTHIWSATGATARDIVALW